MVASKKTQKNIWAVVCGAIRDELELRLTMDELLRLRAEGTLKGILISTWFGEFEAFPELRKEIEQAGVEIIEQQPLENRVTVGKTNSVNYFRQAMQLQIALDKLPEDCFVLKARTDRSLNHLKLVEPYLTKRPGKIENKKELRKYKKVLPKIFEYPMTIFNAKTQRILHFSDFIFYGYKQDVRKLLQFDLAELYLDRDLVANTQWFVYPFLRNIPVIRDYFRLINFRPLITEMKDYLAENDDATPIPQFFYRVYATYLMILDYYFDLVDLTPRELEEDSTYHFFDLFGNAKEKGMSFTRLGSALLSNEVVKRFLNLDNLGTTASDLRFSQILLDEDVTRCASAEEFAEMKAFRDENGWFKSKGWLRERNWRAAPVEQPTDYQEELLSYQFEELTSEESAALLEELRSAEAIDRYLYNFWLNSPELGAASAEEMILPFARTQNQDGVMLVSRLLRLGKIKKADNDASIRNLIKVVSNIQTQRRTANIKTYQMMLNVFLADRTEKEFDQIYLSPQGQRILRQYLTTGEYDHVQQNNYSKQELADYFYERSEYYDGIGKGVLSLRLEEMGAEIALSADSMERIRQRYERDNNRRNLKLSERSHSFFVEQNKPNEGEHNESSDDENL